MVRVFKNIGKGNECLICGTDKDGDCILVAIDGTQKGYNVQAKPVHLECLELRMLPDHNIIYQKYGQIPKSEQFPKKMNKKEKK